MKRYRNLEGHSGVVAYQIQPDAIAVKFVSGETYDYTYAAPGREHVENMKLLAEHGRGLSTYIAQFVREDFARKY